MAAVYPSVRVGVVRISQPRLRGSRCTHVRVPLRGDHPQHRHDRALDERALARANRDWAASDRLRDELLAPFPVNARVRAYVDRAHPQHAFLIHESTNGPIVFLVLGLLMPFLGWLTGKYII